MLVIEEILSQRGRSGWRCRPTSCASATSIATATPRTTASAVDDAGRISDDLDAAEGDERASTQRRGEVGRVQRGAPARQARPGDHAGEVRHLVHRHVLQPGAARWCSIYRDGSVQVNHGGTEMGQGLFTKIQQIAADGLGVPLDRVRLMPTRTDKVPNTSATAASAGTDLNGAAVVDACAQLRGRLRRSRRRCSAASRPTCASPTTSSRRRPHACRSPSVCEAAYCSACRCSRRATTARRTSTSIRRPAAASRSTTSPTAPRCRRWRWTASPASTGCCAPTSCRTSATRSRRSSIAARSKAASSRAWAG